MSVIDAPGNNANGSGGTSGTGGVDGSGGTSGTGGVGATCRSPETYHPGACYPTYSQQVARAQTTLCDGDNKVYTGTCDGFQAWAQTFRDSDPRDRIWCFYGDQGALVGERVCSDVPLCNDLACLTSGTLPNSFPFFPQPGKCSSGTLTSICD